MSVISTGEYLGSGEHRRVYLVEGQPDIVAKLEFRHGFAHNWSEFDIWRQADSDLRRVLAPVVGILKDGHILLMKRTQPVSSNQVHFLPALFLKRDFDAHRFNFGWFEGEIVCHDYAFLA